MQDQSPLLAAALWVQGVMTGSIARMIAVLAVAALGIAILAGRASIRRAVQLVLGMFVIFGGSSIVSGLAHGEQDGEPATASPVAAPPPIVVAQPSASVYDPYAGASVPAVHATPDLSAAHP